MAEADLFQALSLFNPHWAGGDVSPLVRRHPHVRRSFGHMRNRIRELPFELMAGPRQVGKTTLMGHLMEDLLQNEVPRQHVVYVLVDSPPISLELNGSLEPLLATLERFVLRQPLSALEQPLYLFIDEIQALPDWDAQLKGLYDRYHPTLRVLATGSSSAALVNPPRADFAGRVARSRLYPLKFGETLELADPKAGRLTENARRIRQRVDWSAPPFQVRASLREALERLYVDASRFRSSIQQAYDAYLVRGGYPAAQPPSPEEAVYRFFETGIDTILAKDLKTYESIRKPAGYRTFLGKLARDHGGKFVAAQVARDVGADATTMPQWLDVSVDLFLVERLEPLSESFRAVPRKAEKVFIQDPGVLSYLTGQTGLADLERTGRVGAVLEGVVLDHAKRLQFNAFKGRSATIGFWERPEVDLIVELPRLHLAVEVKRGARKAGGRLAAQFGGRDDVIPIVVSDERFDLSDEVWHMPAWLFMLTA